MATARELFERAQNFEFGTEVGFAIEGGDDVTASVKIVYDYEGGSKYLKVYIPETRYAVDLMIGLVNGLEVIWEQERGVDASMSLTGHSEKVSNLDLKFSGRLLVWTPNIVLDTRLSALRAMMAANGMSLLLRDAGYVELRNKYESPIAFISHDTRDKPLFVADLAKKLTSALCPVWYDEYSLKPGDSLRESIEDGLKKCPSCIVVLSKHFFDNPGWVRREFDSIYAREVLEGRRIMIPIWLGVTKEQVYEYSPVLIDRVGIDASLGIDEVARRLMGVLNYRPPDLTPVA